MRPVIFSKLYVAVFTVIFLFNITNSTDTNNYQGIPDLIYYINGSYIQQNLHRYTRQNTPKCRIPINPLNTTYKIISKTQTNLTAGDDAENLSVLQIICNSEFFINPIAESNSICINGKWTPPLTNCLRACPSLTSINSTNVKCSWIDHIGNHIPLPDCINPVEGTAAFLSCNTWYEEPNIKKNPIQVCKQGKWDPHISECYPICGVKRPEGKTNIINGTNAEFGDYPWQIGVYNTQKEFLCGGSILDYRVILSAAHCFTDYNGHKNPPENYLIASGKYYRKYDDERDKFAQYSKILKIHIPSRYKGLINLQGYDIAVLILTTPLEISPSVQPICIELDEESKSFNLTLNKYGIVTGWGYTKSGRELSEVLKEIIIPYIPYEQCFQMVPLRFRRYITHDKICGGYINSSSAVCGGDSGGSYVFKKLNSDRHFVKGIVSGSPTTVESVCDPDQYSVYTFVDEYIDFIRYHLTTNRIHQSLYCKQDNCKEEIPSEEDCSNSNDFACRNAKIHCILPNVPIVGKYRFNASDSYTPGGYAEVNSSLQLKCSSGFLSSIDTDVEFYCSDKGKWNPPLRTCADRPGYCRGDGSFYVKEGTTVPAPVGICGTIKCEDSKVNRFSYLICPAVFVQGCTTGPHDYTKVYPDCCPKNICPKNVNSTL